MATNVPAISFTDKGLILPDETAILAGRMADINAAFGGGINPALNTPQGQLAQSEAAIIGDKNDQIAEIVNQINPDYASGRWQEAIGRIYFMDRIAASGTVVAGICTGLVGTVIPQGSVARDNSGYLYYSLSTVTIPASGNVTVDFQCTTTGPIACAAGALKTIYRAVIGWESVRNDSAGTPGVDVESRADFEFRRRNSVAINASGSASAIYAAVLSVPDVLDAYVIDNPLGITVETGATKYPILNNSIYIAVVGGDKDAIAKAIWTKKSCGCNYNGNTTAVIIDDKGYVSPYPTYIVKWVTPKAVPIFFDVAISNNAKLPSDIIKLVRDTVIDAFNGGDGGVRARIGSAIYAGRYYSRISAIDPTIEIQSITLGLSAEAQATSIMIGIDQRPTLTPAGIRVRLV